MSKKIVLSGYFGFDNLGDEAILYSMIHGIGAIPDVELVVLSGNPEKTREKFKVRAVDRMGLAAVLKEIKSCDLFVSGGGSLLQDVTSKRSLLYYLGLLKMAKFFKKKVMIYSQGIGPVTDPKNRAQLAKVFKKIDVINVRDNESKGELVQMGVQSPISVTADTVFLLDPPEKETGQGILEKLGYPLSLGEEKTEEKLEEKILREAEQVHTDQRTEEEKQEEILKNRAFTLGLSIRPWQECKQRIIEEVGKTIEKLRESYPRAQFVLLPFHHPGDLELSRQLYDAMADQDRVYLLEDALNEREMLSLMTHMDLVISMRLHGLIFGTVAGAYPIGISYDPKIQSLLKELQLPPAPEVENLDAEDLFAQVQEALQALEDRKADMVDQAELMQKRARENIDMIRRLLS